MGPLEQEASKTSMDIQNGQRVTIQGRTPHPILQKQEQRAEADKPWYEDVWDFGVEQIWKLIKEFAPDIEPILREVINEGIFEWLKKKIVSALDSVINTLLEPVQKSKKCYPEPLF